MLVTLISPSKSARNVHSTDLINPLVQSLVKLIMILAVGLVVATSSTAATRPAPAASQSWPMMTSHNSDPLTPRETTFGRRLGALPLTGSSQLNAPSRPARARDTNSIQDRAHYHSSSQEDLSPADQMDEPTFSSGLSDQDSADQDRIGAGGDQVNLDQFGDLKRQLQSRRSQQQLDRGHHRDNTNYNENDEATENSHDSPDRNFFINNHNSHLRVMRDMFERRHLDHNNNNNPQHHHSNKNRLHSADRQQVTAGNPVQSSQELSPIAIGLDPGSPFAMPPFQMGPNDGATRPQMSNADNLDGGGGLGPVLPFGLNPLPHLMGFQSGAFDGPQRGDQSAHSNHHAAAMPQADSEPASGSGGGSSQKSWPKIFRFTDGRINLSDFEKQKKIRLSSKHGENHIESAPIMFDGRPLKRKSFLILHGGVFPGN